MRTCYTVLTQHVTIRTSGGTCHLRKNSLESHFTSFITCEVKLNSNHSSRIQNIHSRTNHTTNYFRSITTCSQCSNINQSFSHVITIHFYSIHVNYHTRDITHTKIISSQICHHSHTCSEVLSSTNSFSPITFDVFIPSVYNGRHLSPISLRCVQRKLPCS